MCKQPAQIFISYITCKDDVLVIKKFEPCMELSSYKETEFKMLLPLHLLAPLAGKYQDCTERD